MWSFPGPDSLFYSVQICFLYALLFSVTFIKRIYAANIKVIQFGTIIVNCLESKPKIIQKPTPRTKMR